MKTSVTVTFSLSSSFEVITHQLHLAALNVLPMPTNPCLDVLCRQAEPRRHIDDAWIGAGRQAPPAVKVDIWP